MMRRFALALMICLWAPSIAVAHPYFTNEPSSGQRIVDCSFLTHTCAGEYTSGTVLVNGTAGNIVSDPAGPVSPPSAIQATLNLATFFGNMEWFWWDSQADAALFVGHTLTISPTYGVSLVGCSKFNFVRSFNQAFGAITNGTFLFCGDGPTKQVRFSHNTQGLNNAHICGGDAIGNMCFPNVGPSTFQRGTPMKFEACIEASTCPTCRDGVLKWWVDGVLAGSYTTLNYGGNNVNEVSPLNATWDGPSGLNGQGFTTETYQRTDHMIVRRGSRGMCSGTNTGEGGITPPGQVTSVTVTQIN